MAASWSASASGTIDTGGAARLIGTAMHRSRVIAALAVGCALGSPPAAALVGGAEAADETAAARHAVLIVGSRGTSCTGAAIARDLVLTAAHCVPPGATYKLVEFDERHQPSLQDIASVMPHPQFNLQSLIGHRATADLALIKLVQPLAAHTDPVPLGTPRGPVTVGERFLVVGYGLAERRNPKSGGTIRAAILVATGRPGSLQIRLVDPATRGERPGLGACAGDSGAPVFEEAAGGRVIIGLVSWSTGPAGSAGCGGLTGVTPLSRYRAWVVETARTLGSPLR